MLILKHITPVMYVDPSGMYSLSRMTKDEIEDFLIKHPDYNPWNYTAASGKTIIEKESRNYSDSEYMRFMRAIIDDEYYNCVRICEANRHMEYNVYEYSGIVGGAFAVIALGTVGPLSSVSPLAAAGIALGGFIVGAPIGAVAFHLRDSHKEMLYNKCMNEAKKLRNIAYDDLGVNR